MTSIFGVQAAYKYRPAIRAMFKQAVTLSNNTKSKHILTPMRITAAFSVN